VCEIPQSRSYFGFGGVAHSVIPKALARMWSASVIRLRKLFDLILVGVSPFSRAIISSSVSRSVSINHTHVPIGIGLKDIAPNGQSSRPTIGLLRKCESNLQCRPTTYGEPRNSLLAQTVFGRKYWTE